MGTHVEKGGWPTHSYKKDWVKNFIANDPGVDLLGERVYLVGAPDYRRLKQAVCKI